MCGRFHQSSPAKDIQQHFATQNVVAYSESYNVTPSQLRPIVQLNAQQETEMHLSQWGLVPSWAKDIKLAPINAKAETLREKPFFRAAYKSRRCIVPINGFYEWQGEKGNKSPYYIYPSSSPFFALAGLWECRETPEEVLHSFTIITTEANPLMQTIHHRMPVILAKEHYQHWLIDGSEDLLKPCPDEWMAMHAVSKRVNKPGNDGAKLIQTL